jgi:ribosome biogenesis GTPase
MKLQTLGWNDRFESLFEQFRALNLQPARIVRVDRGAVTAQAELGTVTASIAGRLSTDGEVGPPAVGDWVGLDESGGGAVVRVILPRTGALSRRRPGESDHEQVAAANVDLVLIVESLGRGPNPRRIERACAIAWDGGATPVVVLTKLDLVENLEAAAAKAREGAPFADVIAVSARTGDGMGDLAAMLVENTTAVLLGPSGVGKSTLANRLLGEERFATGHVRDSDLKGRHTTAHRELVILPGGACLIDTPGVRELGLWLDPEAVGAAFPEIEEAARRCRFRDCRHENEPGCAVLKDVDRGALDPARLASFLRLRREAENLDMRRDESRRFEVRARERSFGRMVREVIRHKKHR